MNQAYQGAGILVPNKHSKSRALASSFLKHLGASVQDYFIDTDTLGTFSGEVERMGSALECARRKCELGFEAAGAKFEYFLASEGSFGPHPQIPFMAWDQEILYFIDRKRGFHLHMIYGTEKTNYEIRELETLNELNRFSKSIQFPTHALIIRPKNPKTKQLVFKGIDTQQQLEAAFIQSLEESLDSKVLASSDMRANFNPTRMTAISELANLLAQRLNVECPGCNTPGWGTIGFEKGLVCEYCRQPTQMIIQEIHGCALCSHIEKLYRTDGLKVAPQTYCGWCNP